MLAPQTFIATHPTWDPSLFYRYGALTRLLEQWVEAFPALATLSSIGHSHEGRDIWCMTLTNAATGPHDTKPAYFIDANIHAGEVTGSSVALFTIHHLLTQHGPDPLATRLLDDMAIYIVPRVSVDGAERYLEGPHTLRSSTRPYPHAEEAHGLRLEDLDGDGSIVSMRVADPTGPWKVHPEDARLMVRRAPDEVGGTYYWVLPEGIISDYEPATDGLLGEVKLAPRLHGLDLNRNFPVDWEPEGLTAGAGPYPLSEPESRAIAEFLVAHPNITGSQHYHTFSGVILRPSSRRPDIDVAPSDLRRFKALGAIGTEETGYPCISIYESFTEDKRRLHAGMGLDWVYDHLGLLAFSTELWCFGSHVGRTVEDPLKYYFGDERQPEDDLAMLRWIDEHLDGFGFAPWTPFDHPQLGPVEIGGWHYKYIFQNAPGPLLAEISARNAAFTLRAAACAPRVRLRETAVTALGAGLYRVEAVAENVGFLPTQVTERAIAMKAVRADRLTLGLSAGLSLVMGDLEMDIGHLRGRSDQYEPIKLQHGYGVPTRRKVSWIVRTEKPGATVTLSLRSVRGGQDTLKLTLAT